MRISVFALAAAGALAACNPAAPGGGGVSTVFPDLSQGAYRLEATVTDDDGVSMPMVLIRDGAKMRIEASRPEGASAIVVNPDTGQTFMISEAGGRTVAMLVSSDDYENPAAQWQTEMAGSSFVGPCSAAGETGAEWTRTDEAGEVSTACVTNDGIVLRGTENGRTTWEATRVQRGPQNADLFRAPPGVEVVDMGAMMNDAIESARAAAGQN
jgi:hypothetical protein